MNGVMPRTLTRMTLRNVLMSLLGVMVLVLRRHYSGPGEQLVLSYAGNLGVSFAMYFAAASSTQQFKRPRLYAALMALAAVTLFEVTDGFGFMANVWDAWDLVANAAGILLALIVDRATARALL